MDAAVASVSEKRVCAMHQRNPMHTLFSNHGKLLDANKGATEAFQQDQAGGHNHQQICPLLLACLLTCVFQSLVGQLVSCF